MTASPRLHLLVALLGASSLLLACPADPTPPKNDGGTSIEECFEDSQCPDEQLFFCNTSTSKCEPACRSKADCTAAVRGAEFALSYCDQGLGCQCDEGKCVGSLCSADADCGSQVCREGACVDAPAASTITSCQISPDYAILRTGAKAKFYVSAWAGTTPVVTKEGATWSAIDAAVTGSGTGLSQEFTAGSTNSSAVEAVQAAFGGITCKAKVLVLAGPSAANKLAVVVNDELTGRPISGATVLASSTTGATLGTTELSDATGRAELTIPGGNNSVTVSVFHNDYNYLTIANYDFTSTTADARFLSFVLRRNQVDKYGGYKGGFDNVPQNTNVHFGIAGMSIAGSIMDLSLQQLLGNTVPTDVKIGNTIDAKAVPLPAGTYIGFSDQVIKGTVSAQGLAGVCTDASGAVDETAIAQGTCGTRSAWALVGDVPLGDLPVDAFTGGGSTIDYGKVLSRIIPIFKKFNSSVVRDVKFTLQTTPLDANGDPDFSNTSHFTTQNHDFAGVPLAFNFVVRSPDLPKFKDTYVDGVFMLGGANVQGRGIVPLGVGAAVNTGIVDAKTDVQSGLPSPGLVSLRMAPTHSGAEGTEYGVISLAISLKSVTDATAGAATSGIFGRLPSNQLKFDPTGTSVVDFPAGYLPFPENAKYNFTNAQQGALGPRTFKFSSSPTMTGVSAIRVMFTDRADHRWAVMMDPADATTGFVLPTPPGAYAAADRTFNTGSSTGSRSAMVVQMVRLNENPASTSGAAIDFTKLVEFNSFNSDRQIDFTTGFSFLDYNRPSVQWVTPANGGTVAAGGSIKVKVTYFKVGTTASDDGTVRVSFPNGPSTCTPIDGTTDASQGKGEILLTLPAGCSGSNVRMTATLLDISGQPLDPAVSSSIDANIQ